MSNSQFNVYVVKDVSGCTTMFSTYDRAMWFVEMEAASQGDLIVEIDQRRFATYIETSDSEYTIIKETVFR